MSDSETGEDNSWYQRAACLGAPAHIFFPARGESTKPARQICQGCPVQEQCYQVGLLEKKGIWAGTTERQRRQIRRERNVLDRDRRIA